MKYVAHIFVVVLTFVVCKGSDIVPNNAAEKQILFLLEKWRTGDVETFPFRLPPLDVIKIPAMNGIYKEKNIRLTYSTSEILGTGVSNFSVVALNVSESKLEALGFLQIPFVNIKSENYEIDGNAYYIYKLKGSGKMDIGIHNVTLGFGYRLSTNGTSTTIEDFLLDFEVQSVEVNLENSSWPINKVLNRDGVKILNEYRDNIVNTTDSALRFYLTDYFLTVSPTELFNTLLGAEDSND